jgi:hypothetical protein
VPPRCCSPDEVSSEAIKILSVKSVPLALARMPGNAISKVIAIWEDVWSMAGPAKNIEASASVRGGSAAAAGELA